MELRGSKDIFSLLLTDFGKSLLFQLIPGLCIRIHNMSYSQARAFLIPSPGEQRFERVFSPFVASSFQRTRLFL